MVIYLVSEGADVQQPPLDGTGDTPLHLAARGGLAAVVPMIIHHGVSPHERNAAGKRAVDVARDRATADAIERTPWRVPSLARLCLAAVRLAAAREPAVLTGAASVLPLPLWRAIQDA
jgi:hypothetical protein